MTEGGEGIDDLVSLLDHSRVPVHVRATNQALRDYLEPVGPSESDLAEAIAARKRKFCPACRSGRGKHTEPPGACTERFTPGVSGGL